MALDKRMSVLIVEDDQAWAETLKSKLGTSFQIHHYTTGEEAVENLLNIKPKFVVLDYHLEGDMTGLDTLKKIKKNLPEAYVVMFSAQDSVQVAVDTFDNGAYDYVPKSDAAYNRLRIILRNVETAEAKNEQIMQLSLKFKKERFWLGMTVFGILIISLIIYLKLCPSQRLISWDPFDVGSRPACMADKASNGADKPSLE